MRDPINMINQETGEVTPAQTQSDITRLTAEGYEIAGESTIQPTRKIKGDIQSKLLNSQEQSARLDRIHSSLKPKFLEAPFQAKMYLYAKQERLGLGLSKEAKRELQKYTTFKVKTAQSLNLYINELTGAAMGEAEAIRLKKAVANMEDSPSEFQAKFEAIMEDLKAANDRYVNKLSQGLGETTTQAPVIEPTGMTELSDDDLMSLLQ